jgi:hypothetical protein
VLKESADEQGVQKTLHLDRQWLSILKKVKEGSKQNEISCRRKYYCYESQRSSLKFCFVILWVGKVQPRCRRRLRCYRQRMGTRARFGPRECGENSVKTIDLLCRWLQTVRIILKYSIKLADSSYSAFENTHSDDINSNLIGLVLRRSGQLQASLLDLTGDHTALMS